MNKRTKARLMKKIENAAATLSCLVLVWGLLSWIDVILHNMTDQDYAWWNLIVLFSKIAVMAVGQPTPAKGVSIERPQSYLKRVDIRYLLWYN